MTDKIELLVEHIRDLRDHIADLVKQHGSPLDPSVLAVTKMMIDNVIKEYEGELKEDG